MRSPEVVVVGGASTDFVAYGARLPAAGEELEGQVFCQLRGGKAANQAVAVARLRPRLRSSPVSAPIHEVTTCLRISHGKESIFDAACAIQTSTLVRSC
jgi:hypothetical protein